MTAKKEAKEKILPLTDAQVRKIASYNANLQAAQAILSEYVSGVLDAADMDGVWTVTNLNTDTKELTITEAEEG